MKLTDRAEEILEKLWEEVFEKGKVPDISVLSDVTAFKELEEKLGIGIDVVPKVSTLGKKVKFDIEETGAYMVFNFDMKPGNVANFYMGKEYLFSATVGKSSQIRVAKDSDIGKEVMRAIMRSELHVFV